MPSIFSHAVASIALTNTYPQKKLLKLWILAIFCSVIPDADVISFHFGVQYSDLFGHRGFTHSLLFALILAFLVVLIFFREEIKFKKNFFGLVFFFFLCTASHGILDAMTNGGKGVAFFSPFNNERYFFPFHPIQVSPIGVTRFFSEHGILVMKSELVWIWIPAIVIICITLIIRKFKMKK